MRNKNGLTQSRKGRKEERLLDGETQGARLSLRLCVLA
jgi:hypothetical protein